MSGSDNHTTNDWRVIRCGSGTGTTLSLEVGDMTERITRLKPGCVMARHPEFEVARLHALQLIRENNSLILLIADANDVVRETLSDEQRQKALARRHARMNTCIKVAMSFFGVLVCILILGKLSIAIGSATGVTVLVATSMLWVFLLRLFNPIEFGVILFVLVLLAWTGSEVLLKLQKRAANSMVDHAGRGLVAVSLQVDVDPRLECSVVE